MMTEPPFIIKVVIATDQESYGLAIKTQLTSDPTYQVLAEVDNFSSVMTIIKDNPPDVLLLDLMLKEGLIIERIPEILRCNGTIKILIIRNSLDKHLHLKILRLGVVGIFTTDQPISLLTKAIRTVYEGDIWIDRTTSFLLWQSFNKCLFNQLDITQLTPREKQVACLTAKGQSAKKIARLLNISEKTIRNQLTNIYHKLSINGQVELSLKSANTDFCTECNLHSSVDGCSILSLMKISQHIDE